MRRDQKVDCFLTDQEGLLRVLRVGHGHDAARAATFRRATWSAICPASSRTTALARRAQRVARLGRGLFPGYGWLEFDPTPGNSGNGQAPTHLAEGAPVVVGSPRTGSPAAGSSRIPRASRRVTPCLRLQSPPTAAVGAPTTAGARTTRYTRHSLVLLAHGRRRCSPPLLLIGASRRPSPRSPTAACRAWPSRLGYGPKPSQTAYEYADHLGRARARRERRRAPDSHGQG